MQRGVIGLVDGSLNDLSSFRSTVEQDGFKLKRGIDIVDRDTTTNDQPIIFGRAGAEKVVTDNKVSVGDSRISINETPKKTSIYTEFVAVPEKFIIVESGKGTFAFDLIGRETDCLISRAEIDLHGFYDSIQELNPEIWKLGFKELGSQAENGVIYGNDVASDSDFGEVLEGLEKNQLGLNYIYDEYGVKVNVTESGYIEIYSPSNYEIDEFTQYVATEIVPHTELRN